MATIPNILKFVYQVTNNSVDDFWYVRRSYRAGFCQKIIRHFIFHKGPSQSLDVCFKIRLRVRGATEREQNTTATKAPKVVDIKIVKSSCGTLASFAGCTISNPCPRASPDGSSCRPSRIRRRSVPHQLLRKFQAAT